MATLNKDQPYGNVRGSTGIRYEQDGKFFDGQGREVGVDGKPKSTAKSAPKKSEPDAAKPAKAAPKAPGKSAPEGVRPMSEQADE